VQRQRGLAVSDSEEDEEGKEADGDSWRRPADGEQRPAADGEQHPAAGALPPSDSDSSSEDEVSS